MKGWLQCLTLPDVLMWESTAVSPEAGSLPSLGGLLDRPSGQHNRKHLTRGLLTVALTLMSLLNSPANGLLWQPYWVSGLQKLGDPRQITSPSQALYLWGRTKVRERSPFIDGPRYEFPPEGPLEGSSSREGVSGSWGRMWELPFPLVLGAWDLFREEPSSAYWRLCLRDMKF